MPTTRPIRSAVTTPMTAQAVFSRKPAVAAPAAAPVAKTATKAATKATAKQAAKPVVAKPAKPTATAASVAVAPKVAAQPAIKGSAEPSKPSKKPGKPRPQLVRDGFTMPQADFDLVAVLKQRALKHQQVVKKSELLRAGLHALVALSDTALLKVVAALAPVKMGRPKKGR